MAADRRLNQLLIYLHNCISLRFLGRSDIIQKTESVHECGVISVVSHPILVRAKQLVNGELSVVPGVHSLVLATDFSPSNEQ